MSYEDGARTIFLYTKGTEGMPPEELRQLARYMEHSTADNVQSAGLARLHEMVTKVKSDREVGLAYMKACEIEKRIKTEGRIEGRAEGKAEAILTLLATKGVITPQLEKAVNSQTDMEALNRLLLLAAGTASVEEFQENL